MNLKRCPACGSTDVTALFHPGNFPLSLVSLRDTAEESDSLPLHPIKVTMCWQCTHVYNANFDEHSVEYSEGCRMYNAGSGWQEHLKVVRDIIEPLLDEDFTVVEIGAGDCEFLNSLDTGARKIAVDPCKAVEKAHEYDMEFTRGMFDAGQDLPDEGKVMVIMRHLLEHMNSPRDFLEKITTFARYTRTEETWIYIEVPSCEMALEQCRIEDWTYEHPQHFTVKSMTALLHACQIDEMMILPLYDQEVLSVLVKVQPEEEPKKDRIVDIVGSYYDIQDNVDEAREWVADNVDRVAFWGGAGKSAMMLHILKVPEHALVVDSDPNKWGMFVPGTRIEIKNPGHIVGLDGNHRDTVVATTSWRANDIRDEIKGRGLLSVKRLLKLGHNGFEEVPLGQ